MRRAAWFWKALWNEADDQFGNDPHCVSFFLLSYALSSIALDTEIGADGISVRFTPFIWRWKRYSWDKVSAAFMTEYSPMRDFGGWGIK
jgi:hypothetical protein